MKTNNDPVLSASMLAGRWGVTSRTVTDLAKRGIAIAAPGGGYYERESTLKYIESLRKTAAGRAGSPISVKSCCKLRLERSKERTRLPPTSISSRPKPCIISQRRWCASAVT